MWRKLDELRETLGGFVEQRDNLLLVVSCADAELAYVIKTLEGIDDSAPSDCSSCSPSPSPGPPRTSRRLWATCVNAQ